MLNKQPININFSQGLDTKTDPFQVQVGKFLSLENNIFTKGGLLQKRNGYGALTSLPNTDYNYLTSFNGDLTAIGDQLSAFSPNTNQWVTKADLNPIEIDTLSLIKNNTNQSQCDAVVSSNGLICTVYTDQSSSNTSTPVYKFAIADSVTGQNLVSPTLLASATAAPRVFLTATYFIIVYPLYNGSVNHLYYIAIPISNPQMISAPAIISNQTFTPSTLGLAFDGVVLNNTLYIAWNGAGASGIKVAFLTPNLSLSVTNLPVAGVSVDILALAADSAASIVWVIYWDLSSGNCYNIVLGPTAVAVTSPVLMFNSALVSNFSAITYQGILKLVVEYHNQYTYASVPTDYMYLWSATFDGTVIGPGTVARSVGLASKLFTLNGKQYLLAVYNSPYQSTYFLMDTSGNIVARLSYQTGKGYIVTGLPTATVIGDKVFISYLYKDLIQAVNKNTNIPAGNQVNGIYTQTGINLATFTFSTSKMVSAEIGANLNLNSGFLLAYDGYTLTESDFFLYPDSIIVAGDGTSGSMTAQQYFYQVTYEWSDNQGNLFRSAPSIPVSVTLTSNTSVKIDGPMLRLTSKISNPVKIVIYRWSQGQQIYYQVTSITSPILNDISVDQWEFIDTQSDATILGNNIIYTNGGVLENIGPPGFDSIFLYDNRLWGIDSEDKNLLWFSKQVIESTPVEMSDLLTMYVAPTIGAQGSTGYLTCGSAMDDKLILFKPTAIYYINGIGPDITGSNNGYSQPIFITSTIGCINQRSIIFQPQGLMFEFKSEYGNQIWLLGRDLSTTYIGAPVEAFTTVSNIVSVVNVPGTNQVRFTLASGITLMYDYYYAQWSTFNNIPAISSTLFEGLHTYINSIGQTYQESPGLYRDGSNPTLMSLSTSWINLAGLQGYQRAYFFYLLGVYISPHKLNIQIAYDYNPAIVQQTIITPNNFSPNYGSGYNYGVETPYGGIGNLEQWKVYLTQQRCESFQITISEIYDPTLNVPAGGGFTLSGLNMVVGLKRGFRPVKFQLQAGGSS